MATKQFPPIYTGDIDTWARNVSNYLQELLIQAEGLEPKTVLLEHQLPNTVYNAEVDGVVMFDAATCQLVYSCNGQWLALTATSPL